MQKLNGLKEKDKEEKNQEIEEVEVFDFSKPDFSFIGGAVHEWRQQGPYIICFSCELQHALFIGVDRMMTGYDKEGQPKIVAKPR